VWANTKTVQPGKEQQKDLMNDLRQGLNVRRRLRVVHAESLHKQSDGTFYGAGESQCTETTIG